MHNNTDLGYVNHLFPLDHQQCHDHMLFQIAVGFQKLNHQFRVFIRLLIVDPAGNLFSPYGHGLGLARLKKLGHLTFGVVGQAVDLASQ